MKNTYCVYKHTNLINNKTYIGLTKYGDNPNKRWRNGNHYEANKHFQNAISKYGWDSFAHDILENHLSYEEACEKEQYYIQLYNSNNPDYGYNIESGGNRKQTTISDSTRQKLSQIGHKNLGKTRTDEQKAYISEQTKKAMNAPEMKEKMRAIYDSDEWRKKNSESTKLQWQNTDLRKRVKEVNGKKVQCIETGEIFETLTDAAKKMKANRHGIGYCCVGKQKTCGGFHWKYVDE